MRLILIPCLILAVMGNPYCPKVECSNLNEKVCAQYKDRTVLVNYHTCAKHTGSECQLADILNWYYQESPRPEGREMMCNFIHEEWSFDFYEEDFDDAVLKWHEIGER